MSDSNLSSDFLKGMGDFDDEFATTPNTVDDGTIDNEEDDNDIIYAPETYTCKVYVNPNGTSKAKEDLQLVSLKAGESETFTAGYHTLEFSKPIEIKSNAFTVVIEIQGTRTNKVNIKLEAKVEGMETFDSVTV